MEFWAIVMKVIILVVNAIYLGSFAYTYKFTDNFTCSYWDFIWVAIYLFVTYKAYTMICNALASGINPEYAIDVLAVFLAS